MGAVEREELIDGCRIAPGDALIGIESSGPHSNGYSLIRKILELAGDAEIDGRAASEILLAPTRIYVKSILALMRSTPLKGLAHITGGGISDNLPRILDASVHAEVDTSAWEPGTIFDWLAYAGNIDDSEMRRTFNCGIGMIVVVDDTLADDALRELANQGETAWRIGRIASGKGEVRYL